MIAINNLTYQIDGQNILSNIDLKIEKNKIYGIIGPNGAGKSTLLKHMMRILEPKPGTISYDGKDITKIKMKDYAKMASFVFQENSREADFTVYEILMMGRYPYMDYLGSSSEGDEAAVERVLGELKLEHLRNRSIGTLSGGEAQKVFIGRALVQETPVLFLDEPTSMLDVHNSVELLELIKEIQAQRDLTIVMVLHDLNLAFGYCEQMILMEKGRVVISRDKERVLQHEKLSEVYQHKIQIIGHEDTYFVVPKTS